MLCISSFALIAAWWHIASAGSLRGQQVPQAQATCMDSGDNPLYGLKGQPDSSIANAGHKICSPATCSSGRSIEPGLFGINDGPMPYDLGLPPNFPPQLGPAEMGHIYNHTLGMTGVRNDESGLAFDIRCMFPVHNLSEIPDPDIEANWNWNESDAYFKAIVDAGLAPLLKLPVFQWNSPRITGLSYVGSNGQPHYLIQPKNFSHCAPWPAIAPIITQIGHKLVLKIVDHYNTYRAKLHRSGGLLNKSVWKRGFAGVELMNEWDQLRCGPRMKKFPPSPDMCVPPNHTVTQFEWEHHMFTEECFGEPWTWKGHYWDGTPQQAWDFYVKTYALVKHAHPDVRVGGPAIATGPNHMPCGAYEGLSKWWVESFLATVQRSGNASVDFFTFHRYNDHRNNDKGYNIAYYYTAFRQSLEKYGFTETDLVLTEYNAGVKVTAEANFVGSMAGAAVNVGRLIRMTELPKMKGAYVLDGRVGAYAPRNPYTFPLLCYANNAFCSNDPSPDAVCRPEEVVIPDGVWSDCNATDFSSLEYVDADNTCGEHNNTRCLLAGDMATVWSDGRLSPFGAALSVLKNAQEGKVLMIAETTMIKLRSANVAAFAWQPSSDSRFASLLLANMGSFSTGSLPRINDLFPKASVSGIVGASQVLQRHMANFSIDGGDVNGLEGITDTGYFEGFVEEATYFCGGSSREVPALEPYQIVLLTVSHADGCLCN